MHIIPSHKCFLIIITHCRVHIHYQMKNWTPSLSFTHATYTIQSPMYTNKFTLTCIFSHFAYTHSHTYKIAHNLAHTHAPYGPTRSNAHTTHGRHRQPPYNWPLLVLPCQPACPVLITQTATHGAILRHLLWGRVQICGIWPSGHPYLTVNSWLLM